MYKGRMFKKPNYFSIAGGRQRIRERASYIILQILVQNRNAAGNVWDEEQGIFRFHWVCYPILLTDRKSHTGICCLLWVPRSGVGLRFPSIHLPNHLGTWPMVLPSQMGQTKPCPALSAIRSMLDSYPSLLSLYSYPRQSQGQSQGQWNASLAPLLPPSHRPQLRVAEVSMWVWRGGGWESLLGVGKGMFHV